MMDLLRFVTAGSVDDGKSTLIGRMLYDMGEIPEDQIVALRKSSKKMGYEDINFALLTDGLRAEREQGITIDVSYRYFSTKKRKFIVADAPGHAQYTRNMITGASSANLCLVLIDARKGFTEQTKRHLFIANLLRIHHIVLAVNKMDLVAYDEVVFDKINKKAIAFLSRLESIVDMTAIPVSALKGDFIVNKTNKMDWYEGNTLLSHLNQVYIGGNENYAEARFPIQIVLNSCSEKCVDFRGYGGRVAGGSFSLGDEVVVLPSGFSAKIKEIYKNAKSCEKVFFGHSALFVLEDELDIGRGDILVKKNNPPQVGQNIEAMICWFSERERGAEGNLVIVKHVSNEVKAKLETIAYTVDVENLHKQEGVKELKMNALARISLRISNPLVYDSYRRNHHMGSFILISPLTNETLAAGMIVG